MHLSLQKLLQKIRLASRYEKYLFYLIALLNLIPLLKFQFFPSLDGPAHLYNSQLIGSLFQGDFHTIEKYFVLNREPLPNWTGHFLLAMFNYFLPAYLAEKITLLFYLVALPLVFRAILQIQSPHNVAFSYLVFPFTYSRIFCLGFYNFSIAIVIALLTIYFWFKRCKEARSLKNGLLLFILITSCYFSHIFIFAVLIVSIVCLILFESVYDLLAPLQISKKIVKESFNRVSFLILCAIPSMLLFFRYIINSPKDNTPIFVKTETLKDWLFELAPIICYDAKHERSYSLIVLWLIVILLLSILISQFVVFLKKKRTFKELLRCLFKPVNTWLFLTFVMVAMYFKLPDIKAGAGFVSIRLLYISYLLLTLWLASVSTPKWLALVCFVVVIYHMRQTASYRKKQLAEMNKLAKEYYKLGNRIESESVVLTINATNNWMFGHFSNYIAAEKPIIMLDNYESEVGYFPILWSMKTIPDNTLDQNLNSNSCLKWRTNSENKTRRIDYVFINGSMTNLTDSCATNINNALEKHCKCVYKSQNCALYSVIF